MTAADSGGERHPPSRINVYEVRPAPDGNGFDLFSDALSKGQMRLSKQHIAVGYAVLHSGRFASVVRVYDEAGNLILTREEPAAKDR